MNSSGSVYLQNLTFRSEDGVKLISLDGADIEFVDKLVYLGTTLVSTPSFSFAADKELHSFYRATNSVLNVLEQVPAGTTDAPTCPFSTFKHFYTLLNTFKHFFQLKKINFF